MEWKLLEPKEIGSKRSKNRIVMAPMETRLNTIWGDITQAMIDYYTERAKGGADGNILTIEGDTIVLASGLESRISTDLTNVIPNTFSISDSVEARKIYQCMHEAWNVVMNKLSDDIITG